ncbi:leucine-rich repeat-containing protein 58 [Bacillus rossius redtenbacheri]|uniref:leucine-rich repeat-containing protein 58 n=1 Tax=Bacillus rossius redtenbacheri TaxID=93214 RepID=UPI002FDC9E06
MGDYTSGSDSSDSSSYASSNKSLKYSNLLLDSDSLRNIFEEFFASETQKNNIREVELLTLDHNKLASLPFSIINFRSLKILDISFNSFSTIPEVITQCSLTCLIATGNSLANDSFPKSFSQLKELKELHLGGNNFSAFPEQVLELPQLKYLYLGSNRISTIPPDIRKLTRLQFLYLGGNRLTGVPESLSELRFLEGLVLSNNQIESLPSTIAKMANLRTLLLHQNNLRTLPTEIIALKHLSRLTLRDNPLVEQFVSTMELQPSSLLEMAGRVVKTSRVPYGEGDLPRGLREYLDSAHRCVNPKCTGVYFDNRIEHVKFVDFCGKYRIPLMLYLCSARCKDNCSAPAGCSDTLMRKVLLG